MKKTEGGDPGDCSSSGIISINNNSNSNKRKIHDEILEEGLPVPKHACLDIKNHPLSQIQDTTTTTKHSLMSHSKHHHVSSSSSSSSSVNWSGPTPPDSISVSIHQHPQLDSGDTMMSIPEYHQTNHQSLSHEHGDGDGDGDFMFCSYAAAAEEEASSSTNYVLSSGRWNIVNNQDTQQITDNLTIDKEFEQYFSMLML